MHGPTGTTPGELAARAHYRFARICTFHALHLPGLLRDAARLSHSLLELRAATVLQAIGFPHLAQSPFKKPGVFVAVAKAKSAGSS